MSQRSWTAVTMTTEKMRRSSDCHAWRSSGEARWVRRKPRALYIKVLEPMWRPNRSVRNHWMAATKRCASSRVAQPSRGRKGEMSDPGRKRRKAKTENESRIRDALGSPSEAARDPLRIAS